MKLPPKLALETLIQYYKYAFVEFGALKTEGVDIHATPTTI